MNRENAIIFCEAIRAFSEKPENLENLESYLSCHFDKWLEKWANTPEKLSGELLNFSSMEI